ncbi:MAG TPA: M48 family metalloprotease [Terriglobia bacterium]|nr:M48 family metalloprotease [Terriglobia bacterium]
MNWNLRSVIAVTLCEVLIVTAGSTAAAPVVETSEAARSLPEDLRRSYLDLFRDAGSFRYSPAELERTRSTLKAAQEKCTREFKQRRDAFKRQLEQAQAELKRNSSKLSEAQRHDLHCRIQQLRVLQEQADVLANNAIPVAYQNRLAKLDLIQNWPGQLREIDQQMAAGSYHSRRWGDVKDIGFRQIQKGQKDDIKIGQDALRQMKLAGLMPKEVEDKAVVDYVKRIGENLAAHSDLQVPLNITILDSKEINAFAFPGGYLFLERGLLEAVDNESELAGVMAHEMSHVVARHGKRLMKKGTIAGIIFQAAQVAAIVLTGGVAGIGTYYALQYGFYGLGLVLNLQLLGVSRDYELEADQLGIQYAWNAGYSPDGFTEFFDKIATKEGYINGTSWFRTHPPFYQRMADGEREIRFLPRKDLIVQSAGFENMKAALTQVSAKAAEEEKGRPSLLSAEQGCAAPQKVEYKPGQPIETLCSTATVQTIEARR